ncbi:MAG TPA: branched-chain amino acid ABC transporter permease/ATP-binding protein [Baekduia sp.]|nr:branched-chain amino acid ABC transporter permease/ATP-binding protein [Baekduia sp.]
MRDVWQFLLLGLGTSAAYVLAAQGMVLIHRGSGVVNFAQAAFAMLGAYGTWEAQKAGLPGGLALVAGVLVAAAGGALLHLAVMRRLEGASQLSRVIATLGAAIVVQTALSLHYSDDTLFPRQLFLDSSTTVFGVKVSSYYLAIFGIAVVLTAALWAVYRFTLFGLQTSAVAENRRGAAALGRSPERVGLINWALGAAVAGLAGGLVTPVIGLSVTTLSLLLLPALAAGLLGSFTSFWLALLGGLIIGVGQSELTRYDVGQGWSDAFPFLIVLAVLVFRSRTLPERNQVQARLPGIGSGRIRLPAVIGATVVVGVLAGQLTGDGPGAMIFSATTAVLLLSSVVVTGYAGQVSLAQLALAGIGAFASARLAGTQGFTFWEALIAGIVITLPVGAIVGLPALRARGVNLAIVTLGLALVINSVVLSNDKYTGGLAGTVVPAPSFFGIDLDPTLYPNRYAVLCVVLFALAAVLVANLRRGRIGRQLIAVRGNERAAVALGINVTAIKLYAFTVGSGLAALGGALMAFRSSNVLFSEYGVLSGISLLGFIVVGGIGYIGGSVFGALLATGGIATWVFGSLVSNVDDWLALLAGVGVIVTIMLQPDGVAGQMANDLGKRLPRRRDTMLPEAVKPERRPESVLEVSGLGKRFGGVVALDDVSFSVRSGEIVGLIGPNGAGKTTTIDAISGHTRGYAGSIALDGQALDGSSPTRRSRAGVGRSFQSLELFEDLSIEDNLRVAAEQPSARTYLTDLVRPGRRPLTPVAVAAVREFELADDLGRRPSELSYGRRRLVGIARAVAGTPNVLLLDEPAAGLDERESRELSTLLRRLADEWNFAILLVEHDVNLVMSISDRVVALDFGRVIASGAPDEVRRSPAVIEAYLGGEHADPPAPPTPPTAPRGSAQVAR